MPFTFVVSRVVLVLRSLSRSLNSGENENDYEKENDSIAPLRNPRNAEPIFFSLSAFSPSVLEK